MSYKQDTFVNRISTSAEAKKALLERFRSRPSKDDPEVQARIAERVAIAEARAAREAERRAAREAEAARRAAEREAEAARKAAERERQALLEAEQRKAQKKSILAAYAAARDARSAQRTKGKR